jgi:hypothetical protein
MNTETTRMSLRFWAPTGVAGAVATAAVAMLLSAVLTVPAHSMPSDQRPPEPGSPAVADNTPGGVTAYCYMGRHTLSAELAPRSCG